MVYTSQRIREEIKAFRHLYEADKPISAWMARNRHLIGESIRHYDRLGYNRSTSAMAEAALRTFGRTRRIERGAVQNYILTVLSAVADDLGD